MNQEFDLLRQSKIMLATPMYGGQGSTAYIRAMIDFGIVATKNDINFDFHFIWNESLITRARNDLATTALDYDYDLIVFVDADIYFDPYDLLNLIYFALSKKEMAIVAAAYPKKTTNWEGIFNAFKNNKISSPEQIEQYAGDFICDFNHDEKKEINLLEPQKIFEVSNGFMAIRTEVLKKIISDNPEIEYFERGQTKYDFFRVGLDKESGRYLSEDYAFCHTARKSGFDSWVLPWINLSHFGNIEFSGSYGNFLKNKYQNQ